MPTRISHASGFTSRLAYRESPLEGAFSEESSEAQPARDGDSKYNEKRLDDEKRSSVARWQGLGLKDGDGHCAQADAGATDDSGNEPEMFRSKEVI